MPSSNSYENTVDLTLRASTRGLTLLLALHALVLFIVLAAMPDGWGKAATALLVAASWFYVRRHRSLGFGKQAVHRVLWHDDGRWQLEIGDQLVGARLLPRSVTGGPVPVLRFRTEQGAEATRIIFGDESSGDALRRLRARLATEKHT